MLQNESVSKNSMTLAFSVLLKHFLGKAWVIKT